MDQSVIRPTLSLTPTQKLTTPVVLIIKLNMHWTFFEPLHISHLLPHRGRRTFVKKYITAKTMRNFETKIGETDKKY